MKQFYQSTLHNLLEIYRRSCGNSVSIFCNNRQVRSPFIARFLIEVAVVSVICKCPAVQNLLAQRFCKGGVRHGLYNLRHDSITVSIFFLYLFLVKG